MSELRYISVDIIHPNPDNPRKDLGDLTELADSVKANGILQNLTVVPTDDDNVYRVVIGHRRLAAAKMAGLSKVPCVVSDMTLQEQVQTMLLENMQRSDLTVYEQAQGFQMMLDMGDTVEKIAEKSGFSATTVRRRVKLLELDADKFKASEERGATLQEYMELDNIRDHELKNRVLDAIGTANFRNELKAAVEAEKMRDRLAQWTADLSQFAMPIEQRGYVDMLPVPMVFVENYASWTKDKMVKKPDDADEVRYFFVASDDQISVYKEQKEQEETPEDRQRKEAQSAFERRVGELEEVTERHHRLRTEFVKEFSVAKKNIAGICALAADALLERSNPWGSRRALNQRILGELLGLNADSTGENALMTLCREELKQTPEYTLFAVAYAMSDDNSNGYWKREWRSEERRNALAYKPNEALDRLYDVLISLGYEMSDEEKAMQNGTSELTETV